jgi:pimeloyl-ACP methyl ester carboxylesterase
MNQNPISIKEAIMKKIILISYILAASVCAFCQQIHYGNNPAAGKYYEVRGIKMYTETYGQGKPLLLIHGNGGSISAFSSTIPYFAQKYRVIAVDSRAHGKTIDSAYVIGWSDGGINALVLAMRHPDKVIKLASTGANLTPDSTALQPGVWNQFVKQYNSDKNKPRPTAKAKNDWKIFVLDYNQPNIPFSALQAIKCPSLIICGDHDLIPIEHTTKIYQAIPKAYLWVVPHSGHSTLIEHKDDFNKTVGEFFEKPYR